MSLCFKKRRITKTQKPRNEEKKNMRKTIMYNSIMCNMKEK